MGVLLHALYRRQTSDGRKVVMPAPVDKGTPNAPWWWDHLAAQAADFRRCGFTAVLLPPVCKTISGAAPDADGYGLFDNYDIGSKAQFWSTPTRFGDRDRLQRMVAVMHACGLDVYADIVMHQYMGGDNGTYRYLAADGHSTDGRFPKHPSCFVGAPPRVGVDPVANPEGNFAFGDMVSYVNSTPKGYMMSGTIDAVDWLTRTLDLQGYRIDDTKGMAVSAVRGLLQAKSMAGRFAVGEYFDGNPDALHWWVQKSGMGGRCNTFDFSLHWAIQAMCNNASNWNMSQLEGAGYIARDPMNAVTFVDNPDTDTSNGENVIWNKLLGYALILTAEGYPCVYYRDYSHDDGCFGLKPFIDNLIWIHENLAFGTTLTRWSHDAQVHVFERQGAPGLLVGLNNDANHEYTRTVQTSFGANVPLHDYTGKHGDIRTDDQGRCTFTLPRNVNGQSYLCFSRAGYTQGFSLKPRMTTQTIFGANDLDRPPAQTGKAVEAGRIWCRHGTGLEVNLRGDRSGWIGESSLKVQVLGPRGNVLASLTQAVSSSHSSTRVPVEVSGWHVLQVSGELLPAAGSPYALSATYTAPQGLGG